jgi:MFS family permease
MDGRRGWWVVFGGFVTLAITSGITLFVLPVLLNEIITETHWSLTQVSAAVTVFGLSAAAISPLCGLVIDRLGARIVILFGVVLSAAATFLLGRVTQLWQLYAVMLLISVGSMSYTYIPVAAVVARWFVKHRGIATGVAMLAIFVGGASFPEISSNLLDTHTWRETYTILAGVILLAAVPTFIWVRNPPEDVEQAYLARVRSSDHTANDLTLRSALRTRSFWGLSVGDMLTGLVFAIFNLHLVFYLTQDLGDEKVAVRVFVALNLALAVGTLLFGLLGDKLPFRTVFVSCYLFPAIAIPLLLFGGPASLAFLFAIAAGTPGGGRNALFPVSLVYCFGETHLGAIYGLSNSLFMIGNAFGPALAAVIYDNTGSTRMVYFTCMALLVVSAALVALIRREHKMLVPNPDSSV